MRFAGWLGVVMIGAVLLLARAEGADEKRMLVPRRECDARGRGPRDTLVKQS